MLTLTRSVTMDGRRLTITAVAVLTVLAAAACTTAGGSPAEPNQPLEGTLWELTAYVGAHGASLPVVLPLRATARFASGTLSGNGGCNDYHASYTLDGAELTIGALATTLKACPPVQMAVESGYFAALGKVASFVISGTTLQLKDAAGATLLTFAAAREATLPGTAWIVTGYNNGKGGVTSVLVGTGPLTAQFSPGGQVAGNGGCNEYSGPYTADGSKVTIGPLAATQKLCQRPAGIDEQERQYLAALQNATTFRIDGTTLELRDDSGALQVAFAGGLP